MARERAPKASITSSILEDDEFIALMQMGTKGQAAICAFFALLAAAKKIGNRGVFRGTPITCAAHIYIKPKELLAHIETITNACQQFDVAPWIVRNPKSIVIRSYNKWNKSNENWGGHREGSGRRNNQDDDQLVFKSAQTTNQDENPPNIGIGIGIGNGAGSVEGGAGGNNATVTEPALPAELDTPQFRATWANWVRHRSEIKKKLTQTSVDQQIVRLEEMGHDRAIAAIEHTIGNGWTGIREPDQPTRNTAASSGHAGNRHEHRGRGAGNAAETTAAVPRL